MPTTYILYSQTFDKYYVGSTDMNMSDRLAKHLSNHDGYTAKAKDWKVVYQNEQATTADARQQELKIKRAKSRKVIESLIAKSKQQ